MIEIWKAEKGLALPDWIEWVSLCQPFWKLKLVKIKINFLLTIINYKL